MDSEDDRRTEYAAVVAYHNALVTARFTIAGLVIAGSAFLVSAVMKPEASMKIRALGSVLGAWLSMAVWILELRSRALYRNIALRGVQIEHEDWKLVGPKWYDGFFSRQYKIPPSVNDTDVTPAPPDRPTVFGWKLPKVVAKRTSHSNGFDLLFAGSILFWLAVCAHSIYRYAEELNSSGRYNKSLDASGGSVFRKIIGPARLD